MFFSTKNTAASDVHTTMKEHLVRQKTVGLQQLNAGMFIPTKYRFIHIPERTLFFHPPKVAERPVLLSFKLYKHVF